MFNFFRNKRTRKLKKKQPDQAKEVTRTKKLFKNISKRFTNLKADPKLSLPKTRHIISDAVAKTKPIAKTQKPDSIIFGESRKYIIYHLHLVIAAGVQQIDFYCLKSFKRCGHLFLKKPNNKPPIALKHVESTNLLWLLYEPNILLRLKFKLVAKKGFRRKLVIQQKKYFLFDLDELNETLWEVSGDGGAGLKASEVFTFTWKNLADIDCCLNVLQRVRLGKWMVLGDGRLRKDSGGTSSGGSQMVRRGTMVSNGSNGGQGNLGTKMKSALSGMVTRKRAVTAYTKYITDKTKQVEMPVEKRKSKLRKTSGDGLNTGEAKRRRKGSGGHSQATVKDLDRTEDEFAVKYHLKKVFIFPADFNLSLQLKQRKRGIKTLLSFTSKSITLVTFNSRLRRIIKRQFFIIPVVIDKTLASSLHDRRQDRLIIVTKGCLVFLNEISSLEPTFVCVEINLGIHSKLKIKKYRDNYLILGKGEERNFVFGYEVDGESVKIVREIKAQRDCLMKGINYIAEDFWWLGGSRADRKAKREADQGRKEVDKHGEQVGEGMEVVGEVVREGREGKEEKDLGVFVCEYEMVLMDMAKLRVKDVTQQSVVRGRVLQYDSESGIIVFLDEYNVFLNIFQVVESTTTKAESKATKGTKTSNETTNSPKKSKYPPKKSEKIQNSQKSPKQILDFRARFCLAYLDVTQPDEDIARIEDMQQRNTASEAMILIVSTTRARYYELCFNSSWKLVKVAPVGTKAFENPNGVRSVEFSYLEDVHKYVVAKCDKVEFYEKDLLTPYLKMKLPYLRDGWILLTNKLLRLLYLVAKESESTYARIFQYDFIGGCLDFWEISELKLQQFSALPHRDMCIRGENVYLKGTFEEGVIVYDKGLKVLRWVVFDIHNTIFDRIKVPEDDKLIQVVFPDDRFILVILDQQAFLVDSVTGFVYNLFEEGEEKEGGLGKVDGDHEMESLAYVRRGVKGFEFLDVKSTVARFVKANTKKRGYRASQRKG